MPFTLDDLPDHLEDRVHDLLVRIQGAWSSGHPDAPAELERVRLEAVELDVPQVAFRARLAHYALRGMDGDGPGALAEYGVVLRERAEILAIVDDESARTALALGLTAVLLLIADPDVPAERIERFIDALEREHRRSGVDVAFVEVSRAWWAAERGDGAEVARRLDAWHAGRDESDDADTVSLATEVEIRSGVDPDDALRALEIGRRALEETPEEFVRHESLRASLLDALGRTDEAAEVARSLVTTSPPDLVEQEAPPGELLPALRFDPELGGAVAARLERETSEDDPGDLLALAVLAAWQAGSDPASVDAARRRSIALGFAARFDARNGTPHQSALVRRALGESTDL